MIDPKILHKKFIRFGLQRHKLKNEMLAILPQIYESGIYKKYASSIYEYAGKYGDISKSAVETRLRIESDLVEKPHLKAAIKEVGVNKVAMIVRLATPETDEMFADKIRNMSKPAIQMLSKELRSKSGVARFGGATGDVGDMSGNTMDFASGVGEASSVAGANARVETLCCAVPEKIKVELDEEMTFLFLKLKEKLGEKLRGKLSNKEVMKMILGKMVNVEFGVKKPKTSKDSKSLTGQKLSSRGEFEKSLTGQKISDSNKYNQRLTSQESTENHEKHYVCTDPKKTKSLTSQKLATEKHHVCTNDQRLIEKRPVRAKRKREELEKTGGKCAYPGCNRPGQILHHQDRFSENKNHKNLKWLCREHHEFMHNGLIPNENDSPNNWKIRINSDLKNPADILYRKYRQKALRKKQ